MTDPVPIRFKRCARVSTTTCVTSPRSAHIDSGSHLTVPLASFRVGKCRTPPEGTLIRDDSVRTHGRRIRSARRVAPEGAASCRSTTSDVMRGIILLRVS